VKGGENCGGHRWRVMSLGGGENDVEMVDVGTGGAPLKARETSRGLESLREGNRGLGGGEGEVGCVRRSSVV